MRRFIITLIVVLISFVAMAQKKTGVPDPQEITVTGFLKIHKYNEFKMASVYDVRTELLYEFQFLNGCEKYDENWEYHFRLLASCDSLECYEVNYVFIDAVPTFQQNQKDRINITKNAPIYFRHPKRPNKR